MFIASGDDPQCSTPKSRKNEAYNQSHLTPSATPTPHDDFDINSPSWPRTPASPVNAINLLNNLLKAIYKIRVMA